ncbi:MAG: 23S rRNA (adenine(2030)-N(6))-methyltransferase RlmJ, partial [Rhodoferax sp.]
MFSYRHAFHAGNHADVLKHTVLLAALRHLLQKDTALTVFDTHAGAGLYRLDGEYAATSGEAGQGFLRLVSALNDPLAPASQAQAATKKVVKPKTTTATLAPALKDYLDLVASFNSKGSHKVYPGSPFIIQRLLGERDKL